MAQTHKIKLIFSNDKGKRVFSTFSKFSLPDRHGIPTNGDVTNSTMTQAQAKIDSLRTEYEHSSAVLYERDRENYKGWLKTELNNCSSEEAKARVEQERENVKSVTTEYIDEVKQNYSEIIRAVVSSETYTREAKENKCDQISKQLTDIVQETNEYLGIQFENIRDAHRRSEHGADLSSNSAAEYQEEWRIPVESESTSNNNSGNVPNENSTTNGADNMPNGNSTTNGADNLTNGHNPGNGSDNRPNGNNTTRSSILDDYADPSTEPADYMSGDD